MRCLFLVFCLSLFCSSAFAADLKKVQVSRIPLDVKQEVCTIGINPLCFFGINEYASKEEFDNYLQQCSKSRNNDISIGIDRLSSNTVKYFHISGIITKEEFDEIKNLRWDKILLLKDNNVIKYKKYKLYINTNTIYSNANYINYEDVINQ